MIRLRKEETQKQLDRLNSLQEQIDAQNQADELLSKSLAQQAEEMQALATHWSQNREYLIKLLETEKMQLEKQRADKVEEIRKLEEQCQKNAQEKKDWIEMQEFKKRMGAATLEARKMRLETSRAFLQKYWGESLCVSKKKGKKAAK